MADILGDAVKLYKDVLTGDERATKYLRKRGLHPRSIIHFDLGASLPREEFVTEMRLDYGYTENDLIEAGLVNEHYCTFQNSVIIPFKDTLGRVTNMSGRRYDDYKCKYMNLPGKPITDFWGLDVLSYRHIFEKTKFGNSLVLCEGQFDAIMAQQRGLVSMGVMGINGIREPMFDHLPMFDSVILAFDNDDPGKRASQKMASYIKFYCPAMEVFQATLPKWFNDMNEFFMEHSKDDFLNLVDPMNNITRKPLKKKHNNQAPRASADTQDMKDIPMMHFIDSMTPGVQWSQNGTTYKTVCPFPDHKDTVGSFTVYTHNNTYFCFGCGRGGDIIDFVCHFYGVKFREAMDILKEWKAKGA